MSKVMGFMACMKDYFGTREGQTSMDFLKEVKALDADDRAYFTKHLATVGYTVQSSAG